MVFEFLSNREGLDCFSQHVLPKLRKVTVTVCSSKKTNTDSFDLPKLSKLISALTAQSQQNDQFEISVSPVMKMLETSNLDSR